MAKVLASERLDGLFDQLKTQGIAVYGPISGNGDGESHLAPIERAEQVNFDMILPRMSIKGLFFPRTESMLRFKLGQKSVEMDELQPANEQRVIFGVRPCDAASLEINDRLFNWDYQDDYWNRRREMTTIVSIACTKCDSFCMCTSLKLSPDATAGSDVLLRELADGGGWQVEAITDKGRQFVESAGDMIVETPSAEPAPIADVKPKFDIDRVNSWLGDLENFDADFWQTISMRCIGCGVCTYTCPTCHCFDIQDEGDVRNGVRRKNWDSCSFTLFTQHTSGHNPRPTQSARWRQRIMHKYSYYPEKFEVYSCSGCGRCVRHCPVDMGVTETLERISNEESSAVEKNSA